jgi:transketolase
MNGLALYGGLIPYGGTFLIFSDYCKPSIRLSALMGLKVIYIFSHDSIGLGEDGPTHQPVEQLAGLRAIPNLNVFRPADINETLECWQIALKSKNTPSAIVLSRQKLPYLGLEYSEKNKCEFGAYVVNETFDDKSLTLIASGSEVEIAIEAQSKLKKMNIDSSVVSMPSQELFDLQDNSYKEKIISNNIPAITIEASSIKGWEKYTKYNLGIETFGESAPYKEVYSHFNLTSDKVVELAKKIVKK